MTPEQFSQVGEGDHIVFVPAPTIQGVVTLVNVEGIEIQWNDGVMSWYTVVDCNLIQRGEDAQSTS